MTMTSVNLPIAPPPLFPQLKKDGSAAGTHKRGSINQGEQQKKSSLFQLEALAERLDNMWVGSICNLILVQLRVKWLMSFRNSFRVLCSLFVKRVDSMWVLVKFDVYTVGGRRVCHFRNGCPRTGVPSFGQGVLDRIWHTSWSELHRWVRWRHTLECDCTGFALAIYYPSITM